VRDYLPGLLATDRTRFPSLSALGSALGEVEVIPVPIPHDCADGFLGAYWRRPASYFDPEVRSAISSLAMTTSASALSRLADDLRTGAWREKHGNVLDVESPDLSYRIVVG